MDIDIQPRAHNLMMPLIVIITVPVILLIIGYFAQTAPSRSHYTAPSF